MRIALITLALNIYIKGAETLFYSLKKHINSHVNNVDFLYVADNISSFMNLINAKRIFINTDFTNIVNKVNVNKDRIYWNETIKKLFVFSLYEYDRVIFIDADMLCLGNFDFLLSEELNTFNFLAIQDLASQYYYSENIKKANLDKNKILNTGNFVINKPFLNVTFYNNLIQDISINGYSYDGSDQGYLNDFFNRNNINFGFLPLSFGYPFADPYYPQLSLSDIKFVHFTGTKPWTIQGGNIFYNLWLENYTALSSLTNKTFFVREPGVCIEGLKDFIRYFSSDNTLVEIGSYAGESTSLFAQYFKKIIVIDPWENYYDNNDVSSFKYPMSIIKSIFKSTISNFNNIEVIEKSSEETNSLFKNDSIDIIYIDANHSFEFIKKDIELWFIKVKYGGFLCGHDYTSATSDVITVINSIFEKPDIIFKDSSWIIQKTDRRVSQYVQYFGSAKIQYLYTEDYFLRKNDGWFEFSDNQISQKKLNTILRVDFKNKRVLDVGFGRGEVLKYCFENGASLCVGLDFSIHAYNIASKYLKGTTCKLYQLDITQVNLIEEDKIDIVYAMDIFEHIPIYETERFLTNLKTKIIPSTILVVETPKLNTGEYSGMHNNYYTEDILYKLLSRYFKTIKFSYDNSGNWFVVICTNYIF